MILNRINYRSGCSSPIHYGGKAWYDNEWGYSNRCVDLAIFMGSKLPQQTPQKAAAKV